MVKKLSAEAEKLLSLIPVDGGFVGNTSLQRTSQLGDSYWKVRDELLDADQVILGKGRGGSVARRPLVAELEVSPKTTEGLVDDEYLLYAPLKEWLDKNWFRPDSCRKVEGVFS